MILDDFRTLIRAFVPAAKIAVVGNTLLDLLINQAVNDVNIRAAAYQGDTKFNATAEQQTYNFSTAVSDYVAMDEGGLWWNAGSASSPDWRKLDPYTRRSLNDQFPRWLSDTSDSPLRYFYEGDNLIIHPKPDTTLSSGFWIFNIKKPTAMTLSSHYPFSGSTTEIASLKVLDDCIVDYVRWKLHHPLGTKEEGIITEKDYDKSVAEKVMLLKRRLDISANNARMRGPSIGRT